MDTLISILIFVGIGIFASLLLGCVIFLVVESIRLIHTLRKNYSCKKQSQLQNNNLRHLTPFEASRKNIIRILQTDLTSELRNYINIELANLRQELWNMDIVLPYFYIQNFLEETNFNCSLIINNSEVFKSKIDFGTEWFRIIAEIKKYFLENNKENLEEYLI